MSSSTSELGKQYMLVVADTLKEAQGMAVAAHSELLKRGIACSYNRQNTTIETVDKHVHFIYYTPDNIDGVRGSVYTQAIVTHCDDPYSRDLVESRLRGKGERVFQVGYDDIWEVVGLVNKFLGVSDE